MCFSASASIGAGIVLTAVGIASIKKTHHKSQVLFSSIPLLFGVQQISEGVLWLTLPNPEYETTQEIFTYIFLFFAQFIWPIWIPVAILSLEKRGTRRSIQKMLVGVGLIAGTYFLYNLFSFHVEAKIDGHHILYIQDYPSSFKTFGIVSYGLATILPPFFSHIKHMKLFGIAVIISYVISAIFYEQHVLSVWCFFAAIVSLSIYAIMTNLSKEQRGNSIR